MPALLKPLPTAVGALPNLTDILVRAGVESASRDYHELFADGDRMARMEDGSLLVFRNDDLRRLGACEAVIGLPRDINIDMLFRSQLPADVTNEELGEVRRFFINVITNLEIPTHDAVKPAFAKAVSPKALREFVPVMDRLARARAAELVGVGTFDLLNDYYAPLGVAFWVEVLGMTEEEQARLVASLPAVGLAVSASIRSREELAFSNAGLADYFSIVIGAMKRVRGTGRCVFVDTMMDRLDMVESSDSLPESLDSCIAASMSDGFHTMAMGSNNVAAALFSRPEDHNRVIADPSLVRAAVSEGLRIHAPLSLFYRYVAQDFEHDGLCLKKGQVLSMLWGAGNLDPAVHNRPGDYDLSRAAAALTTFGTGSQLCPGRDLVGMKAATVLKVLTGPDFQLKLEGDVAWTTTPPINTVNIAVTTPVSLRG